MALRIAVSGLAGTYPYGGVFWDYLQYALGFARLGHDVLYIEDTGRWCYDPAAGTFRGDASVNAALLGSRIAASMPELADAWFLRDSTGATFGRRWEDVVEFCRTCDLFINVSGSCWMRDEYLQARRTAFIDSDPVYTQSALLAKADADTRLTRWRHEHDVFFTFAESIQDADCLVPVTPIDWMPTRQPVVLDRFRPYATTPQSRRPVLTTIASWEPAETSFEIAGVRYCGKSAEFERFVTLPSRSALPLEVAMSGPAPLDLMRRHGWQVVDALKVSLDPRDYVTYLSTSLGEWSVAKQAYVASRSGWFSCRSACYLALGVPVIVQDTGFTKHLPVGAGLLAFTNPDEAVAAIDSVNADPIGHGRAAAEIAEAYFDSGRVLLSLLERAMDPSRGVRTRRAAAIEAVS